MCNTLVYSIVQSDPVWMENCFEGTGCKEIMAAMAQIHKVKFSYNICVNTIDKVSKLYILSQYLMCKIKLDSNG